MTSSIDQVVANKPINISQGTDMSYLLNFGQDMTGHTLSGSIVPGDGTTHISIDFTTVSLSLGTFVMSKNKTALSALPTGNSVYYVYDTISSITLPVLGGVFTVEPYGN